MPIFFTKNLATVGGGTPPQMPLTVKCAGGKLLEQVLFEFGNVLWGGGIW